MFKPTGFSEKIFRQRYSFTETETWEEACRRVARQMAIAEVPEKVEKYEEKFFEILVNNYFVPGGRIWYNSGRPNPQILNCFTLTDKLDSKEGWGRLSYENIVTSMTGGGCGQDFSDIRPEGAEIRGQKGTCPGPVVLMGGINAGAKMVRAGGVRRAANMFSLDLDHPDVFKFLDSKLVNGELDMANISVRSKHTRDFIKAVREDGDWELSWKGKYKSTVKARDLWNKIVTNAWKSAEPGFLNWEMVEEESTIYYIEKLATTNPCFAPETLITTDKGLFPIKELVGKRVNVLSQGKWVEVDNFRITNQNQKILKVILQDGSEIRTTEYHSFILEDGQKVKAKHLKTNDKLLISEFETHGNLSEKGAYLKGFLVGDGSQNKGRPLLWLYDTKYVCEDRLVRSALEIENATKNTNVVEDLGFNLAGSNRKSMTGLTPKKQELLSWCSSYKEELPVESFLWDKKSKLEFIAGLMDADGTASDTRNGFLYQLSSQHKQFLLDFQTLLKTLGVNSKLSLSKTAGLKDFNDGYGPYPQKDSYRLTLSQRAAKKLSEMVKFERLASFEDKVLKYDIQPKYNQIVEVVEDGIEELVYCCTVEGTHSLTLGVGIEIGQCGEIALSPHDSCDLGHLVLPRFVKNGDLDWHLLAQVVRTGVRFLDNVLDVNNYPLPEMKAKSQNLRRIGLGCTGLADMLMMLGFRYGSEEGNKLIDKLYRFLSKAAYEASIMLAVEKGAFPLCNPELHVKSGFVSRMTDKIKALIKEHGIRNCALLTQAPTGTVSILSGNCSSGVEPTFAPAYWRSYWEGETRGRELCFHPLFVEFVEAGKPLDHFVAAHELSVRDHMEVQKIIQKHLDNACSKTINLPENYPIEDMSELWLEYLPFLKGTTFYRENSRKFYRQDGTEEPPPLTAIPIEEALKLLNEQKANLTAAETNDCPNGVCEF